MNRPPEVERIWGMWGTYSNIPKSMFYLLQGDYSLHVSYSQYFLHSLMGMAYLVGTVLTYKADPYVHC